MNSILLMTTLCLAQLSIQPAPERIHPFSYSDEPLAIRLDGLTGNERDLKITIESYLTDPKTITLSDNDIGINNPAYFLIDTSDLPLGRLSLTVNSDESLESSSTGIAYRVHRPNSIENSQVTVSSIPWSDLAYDLAREIPHAAYRLSLNDPSFSQAMDVIVRNAKTAHIVVDSESLSSLERTIGQYGQAVSQLELNGDEGLPASFAIAERMHNTSNGVSVSLAVSDPSVLKEGSLQGLKFVDEILLNDSDGTDSTMMSDITIAAACEFLNVSLGISSTDAHHGWKYWCSGASPFRTLTPRITVTSDTSDDALTLITRYNLWSALLGEYEYVGAHEMQSEIDSHLFRHRTNPSDWLLALTTESPFSWSLSPDLGAQSFLTADTNPIPIDESKEVALGPDPLFIQGTGGTPLRDTVAATIQYKIQALLSDETNRDAIDEDLLNSLDSWDPATDPTISRTVFLELLRHLPELEISIATSSEDAESSSSVIAQFASIARWMAAQSELEQEPFLEPSSAILVQTNRFIARFMSEHPNLKDTSRPGQLIGEISSLSRDSIELSERGFSIEAAGVAMIAEWRSRSLLSHEIDAN